MDYKYIEQLLERYWECDTTLEEEAVLRAFFAQSNLPDSLRPYAAHFQVVGETCPPSEQPLRAKRISLIATLRPLGKAAAIIAVFLTIGMALQHNWEGTATPLTAGADAVAQPADSTSLEGTPAPLVASGAEATPADTIKSIQ